jgi:putative ABC transport system substrate-binding protein
LVSLLVAAATNPSVNLSRSELEAAARALAVLVRFPDVWDTKDLEKVFATASKGGIDAVIVSSGGLSDFHQKQILELAALNRVPTIYSNSEFTDAGGLMSYAPSYVDMYRRAATYVDNILKGSKPADLPVEAPKKLEFVVNLKTARQIGLTIPPNVLARADKVIRWNWFSDSEVWTSAASMRKQIVVSMIVTIVMGIAHLAE